MDITILNYYFSLKTNFLNKFQMKYDTLKGLNISSSAIGTLGGSPVFK